MLPLLECQKTDCWCPITSKNGDLTVDEIPSAQCSSSTLISTGLFTKTRQKKTKEKKKRDKKPFVSLGWGYLNVNEGPECSAVFRLESQTIEPVFVLPQKVGGGQKREKKKKKRRGCKLKGLLIERSMIIPLCFCVEWISFYVPGSLVKLIVFP